MFQVYFDNLGFLIWFWSQLWDSKVRAYGAGLRRTSTSSPSWISKSLVPVLRFLVFIPDLYLPSMRAMTKTRTSARTKGRERGPQSPRTERTSTSYGAVLWGCIPRQFKDRKGSSQKIVDFEWPDDTLLMILGCYLFSSSVKFIFFDNSVWLQSNSYQTRSVRFP